MSRATVTKAAFARDQVARLRHHVLSRALKCYLRPRGGDLVRLGSAYGGWWVPRSILRPGALAYCGGAGEDITFDLLLHEQGLNVVTFDPTPRAVAHVAAHMPDSPTFTFVPLGWWSGADTLRFYAPRDPAHVSHSAVNLQGTEAYFEARVDSVRACMHSLGHQVVDLIKMDIEGAEFEVLASLTRDGIRPEVLCVEFDQPHPVRDILIVVRDLRRRGYDLRQIDGWNYTFSCERASTRSTRLESALPTA